jgi:hypothetical protein
MTSHGLLLSLSCVVLGTLAASWLRPLLDWGQLTRLANGTRVKLLREKKSKRLRRVVVGVPVATTLAFELTPETATDLWFKQAGWTIEQQVGDFHFDASLYVLSDDPRVATLFKQYPAVTQQLMQLFASGDQRGFELKRLTCGNRLLLCDYAALDGQEDADDLVSAVAARLRTLGPSLVSTAPPGHRFTRAQRLTLVQALSTGLLLSGIVQWARLDSFDSTYIVDAVAWWVLGALVTLLMLGGLAWGAFKAARGSSRFHRVLIEVLVVGGVGALLSGPSLVRDLNRELPQAQAQPQSMSVERYMARSYSRRGRSGQVKRCRVSFPGLDPGLRSDRTWSVYCDQVAATYSGKGTALRREGALGIAWIDGKSVAP